MLYTIQHHTELIQLYDSQTDKFPSREYTYRKLLNRNVCTRLCFPPDFFRDLLRRKLEFPLKIALLAASGAAERGYTPSGKIKHVPLYNDWMLEMRAAYVTSHLRIIYESRECQSSRAATDLKVSARTY